ncbi:unnamed protein product [Amoebophrya sp. A120]|nr:unnamed protein product [Amoebophrya sp. A120]|eukprot:GSA120T00024521001.1
MGPHVLPPLRSAAQLSLGAALRLCPVAAFPFSGCCRCRRAGISFFLFLFAKQRESNSAREEVLTAWA